jgi:hypothetical protein
VKRSGERKKEEVARFQSESRAPGSLETLKL